MQLTTLIYKTTSNAVDSVSFDAVVTEQYTSESDVTEHPVEKGANVTDNVREKPKALRLNAILTDYPVPGVQPTFGTVSAASKGRAAAVYEQLEKLKAAGALVEVRSARRTYTSMVISSLDETKDAKSGKGAVRFTMALRQITFVDSQVVPIKITNLNKGKNKQEGGKQTPTPAEEAEKKKSLLVRAVDGISDAFKKTSVK